MHALLRRQLKRHFGERTLPAELARLIAAIDHTYAQNDQDRELLERSLALSTDELNERCTGLDRQLQINRAAKRKLEHTLSLLDATLDATEEGILVADLAGRVVRHNEVFVRIWGIPAEAVSKGDEGSLLEEALARVAHPEAFVAKVRELYANPLAESKDTVELQDGRCLARVTHPQMLQGKCIGRVWSFRDITERKVAESRLELARRVFEASSQGILITDPAFRIIDVNRSLCEMLDLSRERIIDRHLNDLEGGQPGGSFNENFFAKLRAEGEWWGELKTREDKAAARVVWINFSTVHNDDGESSHYVGMFSDITKLKDVEAQLQKLAYYDALTGLPNRRLFRERIELRVADARRQGRRVALLYLDLDRFKFVNDSLGHLAGDQLLAHVSERISAQVRHGDLVSRQGGDEFTVALVDIDDDSLIGEVATRIIDTVGRPFDISGQEVYIGTSIGICIMPDQAPNFEEALRKADSAMYLAKGSGKGRYCLWDDEAQASMELRIVIEADLREALKQAQLRVHFQPIIDCSSGRPVALEALVRWVHPVRGLIGPERFIPVAEEIGLITKLENWVIEHSCRHLRDWQAAGIPVVPVSVNLSAQHLADRSLERHIVEALARNGVPPELLSIEVTESTAMDEPKATVEVLRGLQAMGIHSAIDDFGTGYSSLSYLKQLPADKLKIDRSFVRDLTTDPNDCDIAKAIVDLGHSLSMQTVAEGVEDRAQLAILREMRCELVQGWLFAKAMPAQEAADYLRRQAHHGGLHLVQNPGSVGS